MRTPTGPIKGSGPRVVEPGPQRFRVLLVDDEPGILRALEREIAAFAEVVTAQTVSDALDLVGSEVFDAIVADLRLPDRWGDELLARAAAHAPGTRRLLFTADDDPQRTVRELIERGVVQSWYQKPYTDKLLRDLRELAAEVAAASSAPPGPPGTPPRQP